MASSSEDDGDSDREIDEEEMEEQREEYLMDLFTNCQTCLDPISGALSDNFFSRPRSSDGVECR